MSSVLNVLQCVDDPSWIRRPGETQEKVLEEIVHENVSTRFGREYLFREIRSTEDFRKSVPFSMYCDVEPYIQRMMCGENDALITEHTAAWIESVGLNKKPKLIPYTQDMAGGFRDAFLRLFASRAEDWAYVSGNVIAGLEHPHMVRGNPAGDILALGSSTLKSTPVLGRVITPQLPESEIDWKKRWKRAIQQVSRQNVISAIVDPVLFLKFLRMVQSDNETVDIRQLWPDFSLVVTTVSARPFENVLKSLLGQVEFRRLYCTDEVVVGVQLDEKGIVPLLDHCFLEFIPLNQWREMELEGGTYREYDFDIETMETAIPGEEYVLVMTTSGLYRYIPGDTVAMVDNLHIEPTGFIDEWAVLPETEIMQQIVLLREVARDSADSHQLVAVESEPLRYLFRI
ncbi:MAG: GH3 auxin-responsive promoter family protein [Theionarchaea archaeon]|nr:GH3 auxin-responsive promoter family protein [Theionarchaea archaeon]MBU7000153.1 GH3 auxin-responsive promoter family protein [Theionarchaea archaeon]MBU7020870.1 GH3 auxin-responsive promoter family protein [Theionarchaea archaeon]MBU7034958.1 GH3 auxin-responsive promoter family protein [Theionarchaea archaeon]MBU7039188.1 GH3 auxin-responsive promoter family protein [Theionarchaea archaeon]